MLKITAECTAQEAFSILGDNIIFASGSPFKNVDLGMYEDHTSLVTRIFI